jgi:hypothetical protein
MIGTLTLNISKSLHTLISPILFNKLCSSSTPRHPKPLLLENYVHVVNHTPNLQRVSFYSVIGFLYHSSTIELIISLITSVPACRNAPRNETKRRYFKFKRLKIYKLVKISIHFHFSALYASPEHS